MRKRSPSRNKSCDHEGAVVHARGGSMERGMEKMPLCQEWRKPGGYGGK